MGKMTVDLGDSIPSIAKQNGFFWETIWNHGQNAALKAKRKDPNILFPGDEVFVPELLLKEETRPTNAKHKFKLKGEQVKFKLQLLMLGEPRKNEPYTLLIDGKPYQGTTDGEGKLEHVLPADAQGGKLILRAGKEQYPVRVGHLNPIDEISGVQQRLNNLGFQAGDEDGQMNDSLKAALSAFQTKYKLNVTGEIDGATKSKLLECHP
ncbi:MAG: peptidoglycan-binding protein [Acidobacteriaceae bacterium]|nr:peptidoglycan-binding protein [Acidobacteriaceae bacterium]